jgi:molybdenum cofactor guanylyltransferase
MSAQALAPFRTERCCAVVLAGGRGQRMGGVDKGLQAFQGKALARIAIERLQQQAGGAPSLIGINANRNQDVYANWGHPVWEDPIADFAGPLAGFLAALQKAQGRFDWVLTVPCDSPLFPLDLMQRMGQAAEARQADIALASAPEAQATGQYLLRVQPVFCLMRSTLAGSLADFLQKGQRKIDRWTGQHGAVEVAFDRAGDGPLAFANTNTLEELRALENPPSRREAQQASELT